MRSHGCVAARGGAPEPMPRLLRKRSRRTCVRGLLLGSHSAPWMLASWRSSQALLPKAGHWRGKAKGRQGTHGPQTQPEIGARWPCRPRRGRSIGKLHSGLCRQSLATARPGAHTLEAGFLRTGFGGTCSHKIGQILGSVPHLLRLVCLWPCLLGSRVDWFQGACYTSKAELMPGMPGDQSRRRRRCHRCRRCRRYFLRQSQPPAATFALLPSCRRAFLKRTLPVSSCGRAWQMVVWVVWMGRGCSVHSV
ncbi:hypothetical protein B0H67DRAFT_22957 [Lasiosphaeris hirsuta]|uniref:Uncharacterized protein n=1 Tax=Lasiosphaeris hirsuta TaxID=260670 RepID=A0AA40B9D8_9PEZI|nr:hypothetical protein B0H67DRAFT_22957 [Lasiosphaeris hirsuta]